MTYPDTFKMSLHGDREIQVDRTFGAPRHLVFDAFTKPDLVRRWLLGPPGWTMPVCEIDLKVGGAYRYIWRKAGVTDMGISGTYQVVEPPERIVATERFDDAWYPGEALVTSTFLEDGEATNVRLTILYESKLARDTAGRSGMEHGIAASYSRLEELCLVESKEKNV